MLSSLLPNDPGVLARLGAIHARMDDEARALHFYQVRRRGEGGGCQGRWGWRGGGLEQGCCERVVVGEGLLMLN